MTEKPSEWIIKQKGKLLKDWNAAPISGLAATNDKFWIQATLECLDLLEARVKVLEKDSHKQFIPPTGPTGPTGPC